MAGVAGVVEEVEVVVEVMAQEDLEATGVGTQARNQFPSPLLSPNR